MDVKNKITKSISPLLIAFLSYIVFTPNILATKTVDINSIKPVTPIIRNLPERPKKLNWKESILYNQTPEQTQRDIDQNFSPNQIKVKTIGLRIPGIINLRTHSGYSFKGGYEKKKGLCLDYAIQAAGRLYDNGYPPYILLMANKNIAHAEFLYKTKEGFGSLGQSQMKPKHKSVRSLVQEITKKENWEDFNNISVVNLDDMYSNKEWLTGNVDIGKHLPDIRDYKTRVHGYVQNLVTFGKNLIK